MPPVIDKEKCIKCGACARICSMYVFAPTKQGQISEPIYWRECWYCRACVMDCPVGAITMRYPLPMMMLAVKSSKKDSVNSFPHRFYLV